MQTLRENLSDLEKLCYKLDEIIEDINLSKLRDKVVIKNIVINK